MSSNGPCPRDANGNQLTIDVPPGDPTTNTGDYENLLTRVEHSDGEAAGHALPAASANARMQGRQVKLGLRTCGVMPQAGSDGDQHEPSAGRACIAAMRVAVLDGPAGGPGGEEISDADRPGCCEH